MAWKEITEPNDVVKTYAADEDADVTAIETAHPDDPKGSIVIVNNAGATAVYMKFPAGSYAKLGSSSTPDDSEEET